MPSIKGVLSSGAVQSGGTVRASAEQSGAVRSGTKTPAAPELPLSLDLAVQLRLCKAPRLNT